MHGEEREGGREGEEGGSEFVEKKKKGREGMSIQLIISSVFYSPSILFIIIIILHVFVALLLSLLL